MEDGARYLSVARTVHPHAATYGQPRPQFALSLGCEIGHAHDLTYARGIDLDAPRATLIGVTCSLCERLECASALRLPPVARRSMSEARTKLVCVRRI